MNSADSLIADIETRNALRKGAALPELRVDGVLAHAEKEQQRADFERFVTESRPGYDELWRRCVNRVRRRGDPSYAPVGWFARFGVHSHVVRVMRRVHRRQRAFRRELHWTSK
jgi:hypothetical protein